MPLRPENSAGNVLAGALGGVRAQAGPGLGIFDCGWALGTKFLIVGGLYSVITALRENDQERVTKLKRGGIVYYERFFDCGWALFGNRVAGKRPGGSRCILNTG